MFPRLSSRRSPDFTATQVPETNDLELVAEIVEVPAEKLVGYFVVAVYHDDMIAFAHNACCTQHFIQKMNRELMLSRSALDACSRHTGSRRQ